MKSKYELAKTINVGDRVQYSTKFLRSCGVVCGDMCFIKGTVVGEKNRIAYVQWDESHTETHGLENAVEVHRSNLELAHIAKANLINIKYKAYERVD